ncbi:MAG TPA: hypothetical protein VN700_20725 [Vicinamibacterales bacterium]|nr:hypothetical protein [Vicinamibacterales bacterium]
MNTAVAISIALGLGGYLATYVNNLVVERRRERLAFVNKQLTSFYGPLYVAVMVGKTAYDALVARLGRRHDPDLDSPLAEAELAEWRVWVAHVFMPMNLWCERIMLENAHLLRERELPQCILQFIGHVAAYKAVVRKWQDGDFSDQFSLIDYPEDLQTYATRAYVELKTEQLRLIGKTQAGT